MAIENGYVSSPEGTQIISNPMSGNSSNPKKPGHFPSKGSIRRSWTWPLKFHRKPMGFAHEV